MSIFSLNSPILLRCNGSGHELFHSPKNKFAKPISKLSFIITMNPLHSQPKLIFYHKEKVYCLSISFILSFNKNIQRIGL